MRQHHSSTFDVFVVHLVVSCTLFLFSTLAERTVREKSISVATTPTGSPAVSVCSDSLKKTTGNKGYEMRVCHNLFLLMRKCSRSVCLCLTTVFSFPFLYLKDQGIKERVRKEITFSGDLCPGRQLCTAFSSLLPDTKVGVRIPEPNYMWSREQTESSPHAPHGVQKLHHQKTTLTPESDASSAQSTMFSISSLLFHRNTSGRRVYVRWDSMRQDERR